MPNIDSLVGELIEVLDQEHTRLDALRHLLMHEQDAVRRWSPDMLSAVTNSKMEIVQDLRDLEARRVALMEDLGAQWSRPSDSLTLKEIAARVDPDQSRRLLQQRDVMRDDVQDALVIQDVTQVILSHAMSLCDDIMRLARQTPGSGALYSDTGMVAASADSTAWVNRKG